MNTKIIILLILSIICFSSAKNFRNLEDKKDNCQESCDLWALEIGGACPCEPLCECFTCEGFAFIYESNPSKNKKCK